MLCAVEQGCQMNSETAISDSLLGPLLNQQHVKMQFQIKYYVLYIKC